MPDLRWLWLFLVVICSPAQAAGPAYPASLEPFHRLRVIKAVPGKQRHRMAVAPVGTLLATSGDEGVVVWDAATGRSVASMPRPERGAYWLAFVAGGKELACCLDRNVHIMDSATMRERLVIPGEKYGGFFGVLPLPDGRTLVTPGRSCLVAWDIKDGKQLWLHEGGKAGVLNGVAVGPGGKVLAAPEDRRRTFRLIDATTGELIAVRPRNLPPSPRQIGPLAFSWGSGLLAAGRQYGAAIDLWEGGETHVGEITWPLCPGGRSGTGRILFSPDGKTLAVTCWDGCVRLFEVESRGLRAAFQPGGEIGFVGEGRWLITCPSNSSDISLYDWRRAAEATLRLRPPEKSRWWGMLASREADTGFRAVSEMVARPADALAVLGRELPPEGRDAVKARRLIADLDGDDFEKRRDAEAALLKMGPVAEAGLLSALEGKPSAQLRVSARRLLKAMAGLPSGRLRRSRVVEVLEHLGTPQARRLDLLAPECRDADAARRRLRALAAPRP